jgi:hypothetical protein
MLSSEQRASAVRPADSARRMGLELARQWIDSAFGVPNPRQAVQDLGMRRVARACLATSATLALRVIESHRDEWGRALALFVADEQRNPRRRNDEVCKSEVLTELEKLAARGLIERPVSPPVLLQRGAPGTARATAFSKGRAQPDLPKRSPPHSRQKP